MMALRLVIEKIWRGGSLTGDDIIVLVLLAAMAASITHVCTMLATRWGDRNIVYKSLIGSLLVHSVCLLGMEVFDPLQPDYIRASMEVYDPVEVSTEVQVQSDEQVSLSQSDNASAPDQPSQSQIEFERLPVPSRQMDQSEEPDRQREDFVSLDTVLPDATEFTASVEPELTTRVDFGSEGPREVAAEDPGAQIDTFHERNSADVYIADSKRAPPEPGSLNPEVLPVDRDSAAGRTKKIDTRVNIEDATMALTTDDSSAGVELRITKSEDSIERRTVPLPGKEPVETASTDVAIRSERTMPARAFERRLTQPEQSKAINKRPSRIPSTTARTPNPLASSYEDVRIGLPVPADTDTAALRSDAEMVEMSASHIQRRERQPSAYRLRSREYRREAVWKFGGTERSEATVERSLQWLVAQQAPDGHWNADAYQSGLVAIDELGVKRNYAGRNADSGITALVTLAFLGAGYTHEVGLYSVQVDRALDWLIRQQDDQGCLAGDARRYARMYCHAMATYAMAEALGMQKEAVMDPVVDPDLLTPAPFVTSVVAASSAAMFGMPPSIHGAVWSMAVGATADSQAWTMRRVRELRLRSALLKAVHYTIRQQHEGGGWRYARGQEGDVSMFGWQLMSLKSAEIAGVKIPTTVRQRMGQFLSSVRQGEDGGLFGYRRGEEITPVMTAEALFCQQMLGFKRDSARNRESVRYLLDHQPRLSELNLYYWYYGTLAMYQYGGQPWKRWNAAVRDPLIDQQVANGDNTGSWDPNGPWGRYGGRLYSTAVATLTLEVYYRLLPLYRMNENTAR